MNKDGDMRNRYEEQLLRVCQLLIGMAVAITHWGCQSTEAARFEVRVGSYSASEALTLRTFMIAPGSQSIANDSLQFDEVRRMVEVQLEQCGLERAAKESEADLVVFVTYEIEGVSIPYVRSSPVMGMVGGGTTYHSGSVSRGGGYATYSGQSYSAPQFGVIGHRSTSGTDHVFFRRIELDAMDLAHFKRKEEIITVWKTLVFSSGSSSDLRWIIPYMLVAAAPYIATNTEQTVEVSLSVDDSRVSELRTLSRQRH
jgi:hypothetical protein